MPIAIGPLSDEQVDKITALVRQHGPSPAALYAEKLEMTTSNALVLLRAAANLRRINRVTTGKQVHWVMNGDGFDNSLPGDIERDLRACSIFAAGSRIAQRLQLSVA